MSACARCGADSAHNSGDYRYCVECWELFRDVRENGVVVRSRHGTQGFHRVPYVTPGGYQFDQPLSQAEALAAGKHVMEKQGCRGVFINQKTGAYWLIDEYLDAHPSIAAEVADLRQPEPQRGALKRVRDKLGL